MLRFIKVLLFTLLLSQFLVCSVKADCPAGDVNGDCKVNFQDIGILAEQWLEPPENPADLNGDDSVDVADLALLAGQWHQVGVPVIINELMASNNSTIEDPQGQYDDWVELYNYSTDAFNAGGMCLTDDSANPTKWQIPAGTTIPADGYLLIWVDNDIADAGLHANFRIDAAGEELSLFGPDGSTLVDSIVFGEQVGDVSFGRYPNGGESWQFFGEPSPGSENDNVYEGFVDDVQFSHKRGFYNESFSLTLATETEDAEIYYTLDGTEPYRLSGRVRKGTVYSDPILIDQTTCLRAIAVKAGWKSSSIKTYTYIFVDDVIRQSPNGLSPGPGWPPNRVNGQVIDYGMDRDVVNDPRYSHQIKDALLAIPTISLVSELGDLFGASTGIYVNAQRDGRDWERPTSVELINPDGSEGFQIDAGLRIRGGFSRQGGNPKHAFRLFFRAEYGEAKLRFPLFGDEGVDEFDAVDLRTSQNYAWSFGGGSGRNNTMVREVFSRDLQGEMGQPYTRSRYYHLYVNGHYWGLFQTQERSEASYAESYFGGDKEDYDVVKVDQGYSMTATDGDMDAYRRLYDATRYGLSDNEDYYRVQGLNPDGTPNPDYEKLLDVDNLIDFMIIDYYTADRDGPGSRYVNRPNNTYGIYNRNNPDGWKFFQHDSEHTMGLPGDSDNMVVPLTTSGSQWRYFNPHWLHERLANSNTLYRQRFGDRVQKYLFNDGLLTPEASIARVDARAEQIELAIIAESARWGDSSRNSPYTQEHWFDAVEFVRNWISWRNGNLLNQFRSQNWFPGVEAPMFSQNGGLIAENFNLFMETPSGTIYYTLDGSDPRTPVEDVISNALIAENAAKHVFVPTSSIGDDWKNDTGFNDSAWLASSGGTGGVGFERSTGFGPLISLDLEGSMYGRNTTCYIRIPFTFDNNFENFNFMALKIRYDDGFIAYLNGTEVARRNFIGEPTWNSSAYTQNSDSLAIEFEYIDITAFIDDLQQGDNLLAIQGLNSSVTSSDFLISVELVTSESNPQGEGDILPGVLEYTMPVALSQSVVVKASVLDNGIWSALNEATFAAGSVADNLRITEIMYNPYNAEDSDEPNEEYIELQNIGTERVNLNLVKFANGIDFTFPGLELLPGEYVVVVQDIDAFEAQYGGGVNIAGEFSGRLDNAGERIRLEDAIGRTILDFRYRDGWRSVTDGDGFSLTIMNPFNADPNGWNEKDFWRASAYFGGSPGEDDSGIIPNPGDIVINELLAHSHAGASDWIELHNTTDAEINIGGWYLSDSGSNLGKYEISAGTRIPPNGYVVFYEDQHFNNPIAPGSHEPFALSENGERLYLSSAQNDILTGYRQVEDFGASETGVSFGRYYKSSTGNYNFVPMSENTPGFANSYPKVGPIVISEIMYNPSWPDGGSYTNDQYEYVELYNISSEPVTLYRDDKGEAWKFTDGIDFTFPADVPVTIPARGRLLVVKHPEAFMWRWPTVPVEKIYGPYDGNLSNSGERLELSMPGDVDDSDVRSYIRIDRVGFSDGSHPEDSPGGVDLWSVGADGVGQSLTRRVPSDYGNDPNNWIASEPSPGM